MKFMINKFSKFIFILVILGSCFLFAKSASAATYYVAINGSDAAAGTIGAPLKTIEYAIETKSSSGDTIVLRQGNYNDGWADYGNSSLNNIWAAGTDAKISANKNITVEAYTGESVTIDVPKWADIYGLFQIGGTWIFKGINFTSANASAGHSAYIIDENYAVPTDLTLEDCTVDYNYSTFSPFNVTVAGVAGYTPSITFLRSKFKNTMAGAVVVRTASLPSGSTLTFISKSSLYRNIGSITGQTAGGGQENVTFINNTVANLKSHSTFYQTNADIMVIENNIFRADGTYDVPISLAGTPKENWTINNNVVYRPTVVDPGDTVSGLIIGGGSDIYSANISNYYFDPYFTNEAEDDYTIGTASYISGRGKLVSLPVGGDINGNAWTGADIGAYTNPSATARFPTIVPNTVAFVGDSIAEGLGMQAATDGWLSPLSVVGSGNLGAATGGAQGAGSKWYVDRAAVTWMPQYVVIFSWHNNFPGASTVIPANLTYQQAADDTMIAVAKARYWGMTPIVLGMIGAHDTTFSGQTARPIAFNAIMETDCIANTVPFASPLDRMLFNPNFANAYNNTGAEGYYSVDTLVNDVHPNAVGYKLIESVVEDMFNNRTGYYVTQSGVSVVGSQYGPGTYRYPISIAGLNNQYTHGSYVDLPTGQSGKTIYATGDFSTTLSTPAAGASGKPFTLRGGDWQAGMQITKSYWNPIYNVITSGDSSNNGLTISAANVEADNISISGSSGSGLNITESTTLKNIAAKNSGVDITIASGKTVTGDYNCFYSSAKSGTGTYTDGGHTLWSCNPLFTSATNLFPQSTSPIINTGVNLSLTPDIAGTVVPQGLGVDIGTYEYNIAPSVPIISITTPSAGIVSGATVALSSSASASSPATVSSVQYYLDNVALSSTISSSPYNYTWDTTTASNASHTLLAVALDTYGNYATSSPVTVIVDNVAPVVTFTIPATSNSLTISFTSFSASDTNGVIGYLVNETATTPAIDDSAWSGTAQTQYVFSNAGSKTLYAWAKDGVGNISTGGSGAVTITLPSSGGGGCYNCYVNPSIPFGGFKISINGGASTTLNRNVFLGFNGGADIKKIAISMTGDFTDASQENYIASKQWDLCSKLGGAVKNLTCPDGKYTVYAKFYTAYGRSSDTSIASSTVTLKSGTTSVENLQQYANLPFSNPFTKNLQYRQTNADIKRLQIFLNSDPDTKVANSGAGSPGKETNYFGILTYKAVIKFQEKYAKDVLTPWGFVKGTGYIGKTTLAKINELMKSK